MRFFLLAAALCTIPMGVNAQVGTKNRRSFVPPHGFVPDSTTAVRIAEAVLEPIYGPTVVENEKPFTASLLHGIWTVRGSTQHNVPGGVALVQIAKANGRILCVTHGK
jgi:hypothetical protein